MFYPALIRFRTVRFRGSQYEPLFLRIQTVLVPKKMSAFTKERHEKKFRKINSENLVLAVQKYPVLWKSSLPEYKDRKIKWDAWNKVAAEIVHGWSNYTLTETQGALEYLMRRWHNIRDYYIKIQKAKHRARMRGEGYFKKYVLNHVLHFLKPEIESKLLGQTRNKTAKEEIEEVLDDTVGEEIEEDDYITFVDTLQEHTYDADQDEDMDCERMKESPSSSKKDDPDVLFLSPTKKEDSDVLFLSPTKKEDPDLMFLKSLLPDMKRLEDDEKFEFKYAIMQAYKSIINKRLN